MKIIKLLSIKNEDFNELENQTIKNSPDIQNKDPTNIPISDTQSNFHQAAEVKDEIGTHNQLFNKDIEISNQKTLKPNGRISKTKKGEVSSNIAKTSQKQTGDSDLIKMQNKNFSPNNKTHTSEISNIKDKNITIKSEQIKQMTTQNLDIMTINFTKDLSTSLTFQKENEIIPTKESLNNHNTEKTDWIDKKRYYANRTTFKKRKFVALYATRKAKCRSSDR